MEAINNFANKDCSIDLCDKLAMKRGLCEPHYKKAWRRGDLEKFKKISSIDRFLEHTNISKDGCWLWSGPKLLAGYGKFGVRGKTVSAHRFSYSHYIGKIPEAMHICHTCDTPACVNPDHLFLGTHQDNMRDKVAKLRQPRGENTVGVKLTENKVHQIKKFISDGVSKSKIARHFDVSRASIYAIEAGKNWSHLS